MSHRDETFTTQRTIIVTIGDLVKKLYTSDGKRTTPQFQNDCSRWVILDLQT